MISQSTILPVPPKRAKLDAAGIRSWNGYAVGIPDQMASTKNEYLVLAEHPREPLYLLEASDSMGTGLTLWIPIHECIPLVFTAATNSWVEDPNP